MIEPLVHRLPTIPRILAPCHTTAGCLEDKFRHGGMEEKCMAVEVAAWALVSPRHAAIGTAQDATELDPDQNQTRIAWRKGDRADV
jgi:hypothetical protein